MLAAGESPLYNQTIETNNTEQDKMTYKIQRADRNGEWEDIFRAEFSELKEAKLYAHQWARKCPKCAWGVQIIDGEGSVVFEP